MPVDELIKLTGSLKCYAFIEQLFPCLFFNSLLVATNLNYPDPRALDAFQEADLDEVAGVDLIFSYSYCYNSFSIFGNLRES